MKKWTPRGFQIYSEFKDSYGNTIRVQRSSSADRVACWIFTQNAEGKGAIMHLGKLQGISPHLTRGQARRLARALLRFADGARR